MGRIWIYIGDFLEPVQGPTRTRPRRFSSSGPSCGPQPILSNGVKAAAVTFQRGFLPRQPLPALDHYVGIFGIELQTVTDAPGHLRRGECSAAAEKRLVDE